MKSVSAKATKSCEYCGLEITPDPGGYYHRKECHRRDIINRAKELDPTDVKAIRKLQEELERASYVGD